LLRTKKPGSLKPGSFDEAGGGMGAGRILFDFVVLVDGVGEDELQIV
jgi:hypothetical protein